MRSVSIATRPHIIRRHLTRMPQSKEHILISDSAADCTLISISAWHVFDYTGLTLPLTSRFAEGSPELEIVHAATVVVLPDGMKYLLLVYNGLLDPSLDAHESMLLPHHARDHNVVIDDVAAHHLNRDGMHGSCLPST